MTTKVHEHVTLLCACGAVVAQCRCMAEHKPRRVVVKQCYECTGLAQRDAAKTAPRDHTFVWDDPPVAADTRAAQLALVRELRAEIERL